MPVKITLEEVLNNLNTQNYELLNINDFKNTNKKYGGYLWTHNNTFNNYKIVNLDE